jgi:hypothetical protein
VGLPLRATAIRSVRGLFPSCGRARGRTWRPTFYDAQRGKGLEHNNALRRLASRLVGILHGCLKTRTRYDEATAWGHRQTSLNLKQPLDIQTPGMSWLTILDLRRNVPTRGFPVSGT